jgi:hypothetical protein
MTEGVLAQVAVFMPELHMHKAQGNSGRDHFSLHLLALVLVCFYLKNHFNDHSHRLVFSQARNCFPTPN